MTTEIKYEYVDMFTVPLIHLEVLNWSIKKKNILNLLNNISLEQKLNEEPHTNFFSNNYVLNDEFKNIFYEEIDAFNKLMNTNLRKICNSWFEKSTKNTCHHIHNHGSTGYSSVCYVNYSSEHRPTIFVSPFNNFVTGDSMTFEHKNISEGSIVFFPSNILHYTVQNLSDNDRLTVSFNLVE